MNQLKLVENSNVSGRPINIDEKWLKHYHHLFTREGYIFHAIAIDRLNGILDSDVLNLDQDTIFSFMFRWGIKDFRKTKLAFFKLAENQILDIDTQLILDLSQPIQPPF